MPKGDPPQDEYNERDDYGAYDAWDTDGAYDDAYDDRYEVAPDDAETAYELYEQVYAQAAAHAEEKLERPRRRRRARKSPPPPGPVRALWLRWEETLRGCALTVAAVALVLAVFVYYMLRADPETESVRVPSVAPPVVPCGDESGAWPPHVPVVGHTLPAVIRNELAYAGEQHGYQFHGEAGQVWHITVEARGEGTLDPLIRLFDRSGREVASADDRSATDFTAELTFRLPQSGAYCLLVQSSQGGLTSGVYWLRARTVPQ